MSRTGKAKKKGFSGKTRWILRTLFVATVAVLTWQFNQTQWSPDWPFWSFWAKTAVAASLLAWLVWMLIKKPEWRKKGKENWKSWSITAVTVGVLSFAGYGIWKLYRSNVEKHNLEAFQAAVQTVQAQQAQVALAKKLRSAIVIPSKDTTFVVVATEHSSQIFLPPKGYCTRRRPVNPSHSFVVVTDKGRHIDMPNTDTDLGEIQYFSLESYGDKTTEVEVEVSRLVNNECPPPKRDSA